MISGHIKHLLNMALISSTITPYTPLCADFLRSIRKTSKKRFERSWRPEELYLVSDWYLQIVIETKKDGKPRFCVYYRALNSQMRPYSWPLPKLEEIFDDLQGRMVFTAIKSFLGTCRSVLLTSARRGPRLYASWERFSWKLFRSG